MPPFAPVPKQPDHVALEHETLARWEAEETFRQLREQNRGGPTYSFIDGPITANNPMGVHHAWGRSLKDLWQRYHAMLGEDQRYQNGFDCQGLWVEVEVEKALGLNSKPEIESYGLDRFARACRDRPGRSRRTSPPPWIRRPTTRGSRRRPAWRTSRSRGSSTCPCRGGCWAPSRAPSWSGWSTRARSTRCPPRTASSTASWPGTRSRWTRAPASSTSPPGAARRTSSWASVRGWPPSCRSTSRERSTTGWAGCTAAPPPRRP